MRFSQNLYDIAGRARPPAKTGVWIGTGLARRLFVCHHDAVNMW